MTFVRVWKFHAASGREREFEEVYGSGGAWALLFATGRGYIRTDLLKAAGAGGEYLALDFWNSRADWEAFLQEHPDEYASLDKRCESLTDGELLIGEYAD